MPHDRMLQCEQRKSFLDGGKIVQRWAVVDADTLEGVPKELLRCMHCRGAVRAHIQKAVDGPRSHLEHRFRQDSEGCKGGHYFHGIHQMSLQPVP
jgi:hypothetical protein